MDKTQIISLLLGSAAIGALVSSGITLVGQVFERRARKRELLFQVSVDFAKMMFDRSNRSLGVPQITLVGLYCEMLSDIFEHGKISPEMEAQIMAVFETLDKGAEALRKKNSTEAQN
ncbi:MAG TPA: hypothetical protein VIJ93_11735 [bacterium]